MKIFLTGATGFIGSQLTKRLVAQGHDVSIVVRSDSKLEILDSVLSQIKFYIYDGGHDSLLHALDTACPEVVCHVASLFLAQHTSGDVLQLIESNLGFPTQLLEAMKTLGIKRFINTGTSWQHYRNQPYSPVNLYAATKQAFESLMAYYIEAHDLKAITLKLFDTYGPGDTRPKLFSLLRNAARTGETLRMSPGEQLLDLVYIDDVVDAYLCAMTRLAGVNKAESYAVSSQKRLSLRELAQLYSATVVRPVRVDWGGLPYRSREVLTPWESFPVLPDWAARVQLQDGIRRMERDPTLNGLLVSET